MRKFLVTLMSAGLVLTSVNANAGADCPVYPKAEWMSKTTAKEKIKAQGYTIKKFKVDGECYEIYGKNKEGKKVEIYFDAKTLDVVKSEIAD